MDEAKGVQVLKNEERRDLSAEPQTKAVGMDEFDIFGLIGEGSYGKVFLAQKKKGGKFYAIKAISKQKIT